jgi:hypothetical protein
MVAEYRSLLKRSSPGCVCCGKFYLRQADAVHHLIQGHGLPGDAAVRQVQTLVQGARRAPRRRASLPMPREDP